MPPLWAWMLAAFVAAAVGTWLARRYALRANLLDHPGERRSHVVATPRGGGIAIVVAVLLGAFGWAAHDPGSRWLVAGFGAGLVLVAAIGWVDDHRPLSARLRMGVHLVASAALGLGFYLTTGHWLDALFAFGLSACLINIWNFMDGIDGLAASQAALAALGMALVLAPPWQLLAALVLAACAGFLPFNAPRARIFLGDVGSGPLGYLVATLLVMGWASHAVSWPLLLLPITAFCADSGLTLVRRLRQGEAWWTPHVTHTYQIWARRRSGHLGVTIGYAIFTGVAMIVMVLLAGSPVGGALAITAAAMVLAAIGWLVLRRECAA